MWVVYILLLCLDRALLVTQRALLERPFSLMQQGLHVNRPVGLVTLVLPSPDQVRKTILMDWLADASLRWHYTRARQAKLCSAFTSTAERECCSVFNR